MHKLTKSVIDDLLLPKVGQFYIWDAEIRGFGVCVTHRGVKSFVIQYRNSEGRSRRMVLGRVGILLVDEARKAAKQNLGAVAAGRDPLDERREGKLAPTVAAVCDWYLEEAGSGRLLGRMNRPIKASTLYMDRSRIERHIKPLLGTRKVDRLKGADISKMQADIADGKTAKAQRSGAGQYSAGGAGVASRSISTFKAIFAHAKREGIIKANPAVGVRRLAGVTRNRRLSAEEIVRFGAAMRELRSIGEPDRGLDLIRLIALTGFRLNEAQGLRREWLDRTQRAVLFPDTKSDAQRRAIGLVAEEVLLRQPSDGASDNFFPASSGGDFYKQGPDVMLRICKMARIEGVTTHTLRHTFSSIAGDLGYSELIIAAMLGHGKRGVTQGYIHIDDALRMAIEYTSSKIEDLLDGRSNIIAPMNSLPLTREEIARAVHNPTTRQVQRV